MSDQEFVFTIGDSTALNLNSGPELDVDVRVNVVPVSTTVVGISDDIKQTLLNCFQHVAYIDANGQSYYNALEAALNARALLSITAVYTQSGTVYDTDSLDSLKADLVVTAYYDNGTTADVTSACTLSGTLTEGTSTITATYQEKTATFNVTVVEDIAPSLSTFVNSNYALGSYDATTGERRVYNTTSRNYASCEYANFAIEDGYTYHLKVDARYVSGQIRAGFVSTVQSSGGSFIAETGVQTASGTYECTLTPSDYADMLIGGTSLIIRLMCANNGSTKVNGDIYYSNLHIDKYIGA